MPLAEGSKRVSDCSKPCRNPVDNFHSLHAQDENTGITEKVVTDQRESENTTENNKASLQTTLLHIADASGSESQFQTESEKTKDAVQCQEHSTDAEYAIESSSSPQVHSEKNSESYKDCNNTVNEYTHSKDEDEPNRHKILEADQPTLDRTDEIRPVENENSQPDSDEISVPPALDEKVNKTNQTGCDVSIENTGPQEHTQNCQAKDNLALDESLESDIEPNLDETKDINGVIQIEPNEVRAENFGTKCPQLLVLSSLVIYIPLFSVLIEVTTGAIQGNDTHVNSVEDMAGNAIDEFEEPPMPAVFVEAEVAVPSTDMDENLPNSIQENGVSIQYVLMLLKLLCWLLLRSFLPVLLDLICWLRQNRHNTTAEDCQDIDDQSVQGFSNQTEGLHTGHAPVYNTDSSEHNRSSSREIISTFLPASVQVSSEASDANASVSFNSHSNSEAHQFLHVSHDSPDSAYCGSAEVSRISVEVMFRERSSLLFASSNQTLGQIIWNVKQEAFTVIGTGENLVIKILSPQEHPSSASNALNFQSLGELGRDITSLTRRELLSQIGHVEVVFVVFRKPVTEPQQAGYYRQPVEETLRRQCYARERENDIGAQWYFKRRK